MDHLGFGGPNERLRRLKRFPVERMPTLSLVMPAKAGIHDQWIPAFAGMTVEW
jgi:hypothetical protein